MSDKVAIEVVRTMLVSVAAELITGKWMSPFREDNAKSIPAKTLREIERDEEHRLVLSHKLKRAYDMLAESTYEATK